MSKTISINPELFKFSKNNSSRKKKTTPSTGIKMKTPKTKDKSKTIRKNHVLRFIRDRQEANLRKLLDGDKEIYNKPIEKSIIDNDNFNSDFDESLKYLMTLTDEAEKNGSSNLNRTLKNQYPNTSTESLLFNPTNSIDNYSLDENVQLDFPVDPNPMRLQPPVYGCLKNGSLPTYRNWRNATQSVKPRTFSPTSIFSSTTPSSNALSTNLIQIEPSSQKISDITNEINQTMERVKEQEKKQAKLRYPKQRRTICRTFKVGKSKIHPKIGVLISNRTLRNMTSSKSQNLKQDSIQDVKRFLTKKGFIKVGSSAPNDVLRQMYESANMVCGDVQNHNPDNLLYNFLHGGN
jgi:hypothetical protein